MSCFLHPGWECEESTKRRMEKMRAAGLVAAKAPENARIPEIMPEEKSEKKSTGSAEEDDNQIVTIDEGELDGINGGSGTTDSA